MLDGLRETSRLKDKQLEEARALLAGKENEIESVGKQLARFNEDLKIKETMLIERTQQSKSFLKILNHYQMEERAEDVIATIRNSASGRHNMSDKDWKRLYHAVDLLYPDFKSTLLQRLGKIKQDQFNVCYLLCIGLTNTEIQNLTGIAHVTVWRWTKKYSSILEFPTQG